jgi:hypothetical protein
VAVRSKDEIGELAQAFAGMTENLKRSHLWFPCTVWVSLLLVGVEPTLPLPNVTKPTMILMGGFDPNEVAEPGQKGRHTGLLIWKYPFEPTESLRGLLGSVDLDARPRL